MVASFAYVATHSTNNPSDSTHTLRVESIASDYRLSIEVLRPAMELQPPGMHQKLLIDFHTPTINPAAEGLTGTDVLNENLNPSTIRQAIGLWGLADPATASDTELDAIELNLINGITSVVKDRIVHDIQSSGSNMSFDLLVNHDLQASFQFGDDRVSRVVVVGPELEHLATEKYVGRATNARAATEDIGNFDATETAIVCLNPYVGYSTFIGNQLHRKFALLETGSTALVTQGLTSPPIELLLATNEGYRFDSSTLTKTDLISEAVGNVVAHEACHLFGLNYTADGLMDATNAIAGADNTLDTADRLTGRPLMTSTTLINPLAMPPEVPAIIRQKETLAHVLTTGKTISSIGGSPIDIPIKLSAAIAQANATPGKQTIVITSADSEMIVSSLLPAIQEDLRIEWTETTGDRTIRLSGSNAKLRIESGATLEVVGASLELPSGSTLELQVDTLLSDPVFGSLRVDGDLTVRCELVLESVSGAIDTQAFSQAENLVQSLGVRTGVFDRVVMSEDSQISPADRLAIRYDQADGWITATGARLGDVDLDGAIGPVDLAAVGSNWDPLGNDDNTWSMGDIDQDGAIGPSDLATVGANWDPLGTNP